MDDQRVTYHLKNGETLDLPVIAQVDHHSIGCEERLVIRTLDSTQMITRYREPPPDNIIHINEAWLSYHMLGASFWIRLRFWVAGFIDWRTLLRMK